METLRHANEDLSSESRIREIVAILLLTLFAWLAAPVGASEAAPVALGAYIPHADESPGLIDDFANQVGWNPVVVISFKAFDQVPVYRPQLEGIAEQGAIPMITWEPQTSEGRIKLAKITKGRLDGYISAAAQSAAGWGKPMMIRFAQEMNGFWYPWSPAGGTPAREYVRAWRHIVRIFRREGADNVQWVWAPYVKTEHDLSFRQFYPGDRYVDWAAVDGYNWGGSFAWKSFRELFARSYHRLRRLTDRPLMIAEIGCGEGSGSKARWLRAMLRHDVPRMNGFRAILWYDQVDEKGDLRVDTSAAALRSFRHWTDSPFYAASRRSLLRTPRRLPR